MLFLYPFRSKLSWIIYSLFAFTTVTVIILVHDWSGSNYYLRIISMILPSICIVTSYFTKMKNKPVVTTSRNSLVILGVIALCILTSFQIINSSYLVKQSLYPNYSQEGIEVSFPFKGGPFVVVQGGGHPLINRHFTDNRQKHAVDLVKINKIGFRKKVLENLDDYRSYEIFGETIYSPVSGIVHKVKDSESDTIKENPSQSKSNYIVIDYGNYFIILLHLKKNSILVNEGEFVKRYEPLAAVGNSGYSSEPHLHLHAVRKNDNETNIQNIFRSTSVPLIFEGNHLKKNDVIYDSSLVFR